MGKMNPASRGKTCARCGSKPATLKLVRFVPLCAPCAKLAAAYTSDSLLALASN